MRLLHSAPDAADYQQIHNWGGKTNRSVRSVEKDKERDENHLKVREVREDFGDNSRSK